MHAETIADVWNRVTGTQPDPPWWLVVTIGAVALVVVTSPSAWRISRNVVTIAHEGGHALAALLTGRRLTGIRLHSDTSGVTVSRGRPAGPGMVATAAAGYTTPPLLGLVTVLVLATGHITALLWTSLALLAAMLVMIRNLFGVISVVATGGIVFAVSWFTSSDVQAAFAYFFAWFLLLAGGRPVIELQRLRYRGAAPHSDADQLARLTRIPALFWVGVFAAVALFSLGLGGWLLLA